MIENLKLVHRGMILEPFPFPLTPLARTEASEDVYQVIEASLVAKEIGAIALVALKKPPEEMRQTLAFLLFFMLDSEEEVGAFMLRRELLNLFDGAFAG